MHITRISSPFGDISIVLDTQDLVVRVVLPSEGLDIRVKFPGARLIDLSTIGGLKEMFYLFFRGESIRFPLNRVNLSGCSSFQRKVLIEEYAIPRGRVRTYGGLAKRIGAPRAARAVGRALATNPVPIIVPCHRAIRGTGELGGFRGGLRMKRAFLEMEGIEFDPKGRVRPEFILL
jgi:methylated-DNA-[protein]-cysteine S-methyltransferase